MHKHNRLAFLLAILTILVLSAAAFTGCGDDDDDDDDDGDDDDDDDDDDDPAEDACYHAVNGPFEDVAAGATEDDAADVSESHTAYNVALAAIDDGNGGFLAFEADEDNAFIFFLGADVSLAVLDANGDEVTAEHGGAVDACDELAMHYAYDLAVGTYALSFGPTDETDLLLIPYEAGEHHHDE